MLIIVALAIIGCVWAILRHSPAEVAAQPQPAAQLIIPCPPEHGIRCRCTWGR